MDGAVSKNLTPEAVRLYKARCRNVSAWRARDLVRETVMVALKDGGVLELRNDVPRTRAGCPETRPCGHVKCQYHLWRIDGDDRPGRRGRTPIPTTLRAAWMESPTPESCALDLAELGGMAARDIARVMDKDATLIRMIVRAGAKKLRFVSDGE